jgi:hypothetical protein
MSNPRPLAIGDVIHGFAQGGFGRDHYDCTKIEAAGLDWIVARDVNGDLSFASGEEDLRFLMRVRDEDAACEEEGGCPLGKSAQILTIPGGY